jgi:DNA-binding NarL/FixJ family response regulator
METRALKQNGRPLHANSWKRNGRSRTVNSPKKKALTRREREVLACLAAGKMYKEISADLNVTLDTVRFHAKRIYKKLGVRSRTEAVLWLLGKGTLERSKTTQRCR